MSQYAFFLGCIMPNRYPGVESSTRHVLKRFGIQLVDIQGASCCPAPGVFGSFDMDTWATLAARNLCLAEDQGRNITLCCNGCYATLQEANHLLKSNNVLRKKVNAHLAGVHKQFRGLIEVKHVIEVLYDDVGVDRIIRAVKRPLQNIAVAAHYGCHFLKPSEVRQHGNPENPTILDELIEATMARSINYRDKNMCCGAGGGVRARNLDVSLDMTREKLVNMKNAGVDCIVTPCIFCHLQFDKGQMDIKESFNEEFSLPVLFYTQLLGLALGISVEKLGITQHSIQSGNLMDKIINITEFLE
ncbi:CoB--CoM heterodisulfide reductase subunit B [[Eubacterium] cellulosolvens]